MKPIREIITDNRIIDWEFMPLIQSYVGIIRLPDLKKCKITWRITDIYEYISLHSIEDYDRMATLNDINTLKNIFFYNKEEVYQDLKNKKSEGIIHYDTCFLFRFKNYNLDEIAKILNKNFENQSVIFNVDDIMQKLMKQKQIANEKLRNPTNNTFDTGYYDGFKYGIDTAISIIKENKIK